MTSRGTRKYIDVIQDIVASYNKSFHRSIKMAPKDVNDSNKHIVFRNLYGYDSMSELYRRQDPKLKPGDTVRVKLPHDPFSKGYTRNWSDNTFTVGTTTKYGLPNYRLDDEDGRSDSRYYGHEVQKIAPREVEKVIKRRRGQVFVKWKNHPSSQNSWINDDQS
ncbi:hypothetical protein HDE_09792 [Halotydeus destructor]|nr:hypothetical protein HDE_09792 [Halotydeus destructor]